MAPTYLARNRGLTSERVGMLAGILAGLPLILSSLADVLGGLTTDVVTRSWGLARDDAAWEASRSWSPDWP